MSALDSLVIGCRAMVMASVVMASVVMASVVIASVVIGSTPDNLARAAGAASSPSANPDCGLTVSNLGFKVRRAMRRDDLDTIRSLLHQAWTIVPSDARDARDLHRLLLKLMVEYRIVFDPAADLLASRGIEELQPSFDEWLDGSSRNWKRTSAILDVAARLQDQVSEQWLLWALDHRSDTIRRISMEGLARRRSRTAIPALIDYLDREGVNDGAVTFTAQRALIELTGHEYLLVEDWRNFWEINKDHFDPRDPDSFAEGLTRKMPVPVDGPTFFGVRIPSHRITFVIDVSASMEKLDEGGDAPQPRIERAKQQLKKAIRGLPARARFNIIAYNQRVTSFANKLVRATEDKQDEACYWVHRLRAGGSTHTGAALHGAFSDESVDTVVLLSDGAPSRVHGPSTADLAPRIMQRVAVWNRLRRVRVFTFGFEGDGYWPVDSKFAGRTSQHLHVMRWFLRELAARHGGGYKSI